jgi:hypothetical protein
VPTLSSFDYAVIRVVPRIERDEFLNAGVILYCRTRRFLGVRFALDRARLAAFAPGLDVDEVERHLAALAAIADGGEDSGPIGHLEQPQRFHWLVAPRSTVIQVSPVHCGLCDDPATTLDRLLASEVTDAQLPNDGNSP